MFENILGMVGTYEQRKVDLYEAEDFFVSTAKVTDGQKSYETAVEHPDYNGGKMVIVESYNTREEAEAGHKRWVETMTAEDLPTELVDCANAGIAQLAKDFGSEMRYPRKPKEE